MSPFAAPLLSHDLPGLPAARRDEAVRFVGGRMDVLPTPFHVAVLSLAAAFRVMMALPLRGPFLRFVARRPLPLVGEYVRLIRSLAYAYVWETWPDTRPDGSAA